MTITPRDNHLPQVPTHEIPYVYDLKDLFVNPLDNPSDYNVHLANNPDDLPDLAFSFDDNIEARTLNLVNGEVHTFAR